MLPSTLLLPPTFPSGSAIVVALGERVLTPVAGSWERQGGQRRPVWHAATLGPEVASVTALAAASGVSAARRSAARSTLAPTPARTSRAMAARASSRGPTGTQAAGVVALVGLAELRQDRRVLAVGVGGTVWQIEDSVAGATRISDRVRIGRATPACDLDHRWAIRQGL